MVGSRLRKAGMVIGWIILIIIFIIFIPVIIG
jgi:hypothetical protein